MGEADKTKRATGSRQIRKNLLKCFPALIFVISIFFTCYTAYHVSFTVLDSDTSSEMVLASLLAEENQIISKDIIYSTEIKILHVNLIYAPLFKILLDWQMVRFVGNIILLAVYLLSYYYLCRQLSIQRESFFYSASLLILPFSVNYGRNVLYHCHYLPCIALGFLIVGLFLSLTRQVSRSPLRKAINIFFLFLLSLGSCLSGVRQLMSIMVPLLLTAFVVGLKSLQKGPVSIDFLKTRGWEIGLALFVCAAGAIGNWWNGTLPEVGYTFKQYGDIMLDFPSVEGMYEILLAYFQQFGFQAGRELFSVVGCLAMGGLFVAIYFLGKTVCVFGKEKICNVNTREYIKNLFSVNLLVMTCVLILMGYNDQQSRYYLTSTVWAIPLLATQISDASPFSIQTWTVKRISMTIVCLVMFANGFLNNAYFIKPEGKSVKFDGNYFMNIHAAEDLSGVAEFVVENELTLGYATFWNANIVTELTSGKTAMVGLEVFWLDEKFTYQNWLTAKHYREEAFVEEQNPFILLSHEENEMFAKTPLAEYAIFLYKDARYYIYSFDFAIEVMEYLMETSS